MDCCKGVSEIIETNSCPVCNHKGQLVKNITVKNLVVSHLQSEVGEKDYFLCLNSECDNVYFNNELSQTFGKNDIRVSIWFKETNTERLICYCSKVSAKQIIEQVLGDNKAETVEDIVKLTGAMKNSNCIVNNPSGKCCSKAIQEVINNTLQEKVN